MNEREKEKQRLGKAWGVWLWMIILNDVIVMNYAMTMDQRRIVARHRLTSNPLPIQTMANYKMCVTCRCIQPLVLNLFLQSIKYKNIYFTNSIQISVQIHPEVSQGRTHETLFFWLHLLCTPRL